MCVKIICSDHEHEFDTSLPLEQQIVGANEIVVSYDPIDPKIPSLVVQMEAMIKNGISCNVEIKVNANNYLSGIKLERTIEGIKKKLDINELAKNLTRFHAEADRKLREISGICMENVDEQ